MNLERLIKNDDADVKMIGAVVGILITLIIAVLVFYNIAGTLDTTTIDANIGGTNNTPAANATEDTLDQSATFFQIAPIIAIVVVAVVILGYVNRIGG